MANREQQGGPRWRELVHRANLLDRMGTVASSSAKLSGCDAAGGEGEVLWVADAGRELTALRLERILPLMQLGEIGDERLAADLARCRLESRMAPCPVEALLHALVPATHVDLTDPAAIAVLCNAADGARLARACFGDAVAWVPHERSGRALARRIGLAAATSGVRLVLLANRGLVTWGATAQECYAATTAAANRAAAFVAARAKGSRGDGPALAPLERRRRKALLARLAPVLRGALSSTRPKVLEVDTSPLVLEYVCARTAAQLSQVGPVSPSHLAYTRRVPLWIDHDPAHDDIAALAERIVRGAARYRARSRCEAAAFDDPRAPLDPDARVALIGRVGMVTAGTTREAARRARDVYRHAITVMSSVEAIDRFVPLTIAECCAFERASRAVQSS